MNLLHVIAHVDDVLNYSEMLQLLNQRRRVQWLVVYQRRMQRAASSHTRVDN